VVLGRFVALVNVPEQHHTGRSLDSAVNGID